ncbi:MAG: hypothetical protein COT00_01950 [Candidatus Omnitrophica bacterium CG07_land_8_20_14_0_80_50_8]|nr:MAG: hypothetical protein AUJ71_00265 [Candidatus Omnitrophica bacterium CG1_02_49_16]PIU40391.1 MAG: hypothetical protein COT00_01950 [Candidatus Omnitrophica bacterium CG07_land_8_20_14_0_80_50_8]
MNLQLITHTLQKLRSMIKLPSLILIAAVPLASLAGASLLAKHNEKNIDKKYLQMAVKYDRMDKADQELKKKYDNLEADRNNILEQTKSLLAQKANVEELKRSLEDTQKANEIVSLQKDKLHQENERLRTEREMLAENFNRLKESFDGLVEKQKALLKESESLKTQLQGKVENSVQFKKVDGENKALKVNIKNLNDTIKILNNQLKKAEDRIKKINGRDVKFGQQLEAARKSLRQVVAEKERLIKVNQDMNKAVAVAPDRFRNMAEENKKLLSETAEMHYNLGVFYTENKKYTIAVKEFQRALDFNPNNAKVHYNLGYLYSEEFDRHDEALAHFKRFLEIDPNSKESNEVRSYMLVRQTYGDKIANTK